MKLKILLDSSYLLPIIGIEVEGIENFLKVLEKYWRESTVEIYYTQFNLLEISWKLSKTNYDNIIVFKGLQSIQENFIEISPKPQSYIKALELKKKGFNDIIDLLLYATSLTNNVKFLTRDKDLIGFLRSNSEDLSNIIYEDDFRNVINQ